MTWIPVTKMLPKVRVPVLTYGRKGAVGIGFTQPTSVTSDGKVHFYARYGDNLPTHWMPLPNPPKEDQMTYCKYCVHEDACAAWIRHGTTLYDDFKYTVENCPYYTPKGGLND